jgi:hypothetical protein
VMEKLMAGWNRVTLAGYVRWRSCQLKASRISSHPICETPVAWGRFADSTKRLIDQLANGLTCSGPRLICHSCNHPHNSAEYRADR